MKSPCRSRSNRHPWSGRCNRHFRPAESLLSPDPNSPSSPASAQIWRTDQHGTITISFTDQGPVVASER